MTQNWVVFKISALLTLVTSFIRCASLVCVEIRPPYLPFILTGKCSHGGFPDYPEGINKDYSDSSHGSLHNQAADVAIDACVQLLEKILRSLKKDPALNFLRWGVNQL